MEKGKEEGCWERGGDEYVRDAVLMLYREEWRHWMGYGCESYGRGDIGVRRVEEEGEEEEGSDGEEK